MINDYPGGFFAKATESSKQKSRQLAALKFLSMVYPKSYTWQMVLHEVQNKKKPLNDLLPDLYRVKPLKRLIERERIAIDCRRMKELDTLIKETFAA